MKISKEKKAIITASFTAVILIVIKGIAWIFTWSMAILTSAIDSLLDFFVSLMNFFAIKKSEEVEDEDHNYWHGKIEWFWALFEWLIIFFSWLTIIYLAYNKIISWEELKKTWESIFVMFASILITWFLVAYLSRVAKETKSLVIKADALHYKTDLYTNAWIIFSLIILKIFDIPIIDPLVSIIIAIYIIYWSYSIIKEWFDMLMDKSIDKDDVDFIIKTINSHKEIESYHYLKTRKSWKYSFIEFHVVFKNPKILLKDAHIIWDEIEDKIILEIPHSTVIVHLDYYDDSKSSDNPKVKKLTKTY